MKVYDLKAGDVIKIDTLELKFEKCDGAYGKFIVMNGEHKGRILFIACFERANPINKD